MEPRTLRPLFPKSMAPILPSPPDPAGVGRGLPASMVLRSVLHRNLASIHIAAILRRQDVLRLLLGGYSMRRQDVIMIFALLVISSALAILLTVGEFIG
jgi:hypothetical protein